jgi:hypothetical protein
MSTSPALNASPSVFFQAAIPPSVIVGDIAGIWKCVRAYRALVWWRTGEECYINRCLKDRDAHLLDFEVVRPIPLCTTDATLDKGFNTEAMVDELGQPSKTRVLAAE